jgi:hypothetical protein
MVHSLMTRIDDAYPAIFENRQRVVVVKEDVVSLFTTAAPYKRTLLTVRHFVKASELGRVFSLKSLSLNVMSRRALD